MIVFLLFGLFLLLLIYICLIVLSTLQIEIRNFSKSNYDKLEDDLKHKDLKIIISLKVFSKLTILAIHFNNKKLRKIYNKDPLEKIDIKKVTEYLPDKKDIISMFKQLQIKLAKLDLNLVLGTEDVLITTGIVFIISTVISLLLPTIVETYKKEQYQYKIEPIYQNRNLYKIDVNCIIHVKMVHIIYMIFMILKRKEKEKYDRTSNRGTYGYSYE